MPLTTEQKKEFCNKIAKLTPEEKQAFSERIICPVNPEGHQLSVLNTMLIVMQGIENPTVIAGFNQWRGAGRTVREGQHSVYIRRPFQKEDKNKQEGETSSDDLETFFAWIPVFDISQTEEYNAETSRNGNHKPQEPRLITAKFSSACGSCQAYIRRGDEIYWKKGEKLVKCKPCGTPKQTEPETEEYQETPLISEKLVFTPYVG